ncbi:hypothetical protein [Janthinobacterium sp. MDT1-19]|uniref:hypothetical protein n=1 Tax=Janthinobacterium sp. MDT1-19 TaxID=1259339 RepID=UPI003F21122A
MGDFFYYGQKDAIQRLNELAGRGAVVASYAPAVGRSPLGGPNGKITPEWLDPGLPLRTDIAFGVSTTAKYGYNYATNGAGITRWILIATIGESNVGANANLLIRGVFNNNWTASSSSPFTIFMGVREGFYVDWHIEGPIIWQSRIMVVRRADGKHDVYAFFDSSVFSTMSFDLTGINTTTYALPVETNSTPAGTVVFDSATGPGNPIHIAPRWRTPATGKGLLVNELLGVGDGSITTSHLICGGVSMAAGQERDSLRIGVGGVSGTTYPGCFSWFTSAGNSNGTPSNLYKESYRMALRAYDTQSNQWSGDFLAVKGTGSVYISSLKAGTESHAVHHVIDMPGGQGQDILTVNQAGGFRKCDGNYGNLTNAALILSANTVTGRSVNARGTVNTMGNDYAEYIFKCLMCGIVAPGQIVGITADNKVTDKWADAVMFSIKSTAPSFVGGDSWANDVGPRPSAQAGAAPTQPLRREDVVTQQPVPGINPPEYEDVVTEAGDTDDEWAEKQAAYTAALAAHTAAVQQDAEAMATFDAALEVERQKVDRIAIAGRVPVNVLGAQPGDYIVAVRDGAGIQGIAVHDDDLTEKQYRKAVGRVISIEADGRAYVMVKAV